MSRSRRPYRPIKRLLVILLATSFLATLFLMIGASAGSTRTLQPGTQAKLTSTIYRQQQAQEQTSPQAIRLSPDLEQLTQQEMLQPKEFLPERWRKVEYKVRETLARISRQGINEDTFRQYDDSVFGNGSVKINKEGALRLTLRVARWGSAERESLKRLGYEITSEIEEFLFLEGWLPFYRVEDVAMLDFVRSIYATPEAINNTGAVNSQGDQILRANLARVQFGVSGSGVKVGVISDSVDGILQAVASGDLPNNVQILKFGNGAGEGTAMLEIVHDLAPGASLAFYGPSSPGEMITGINSLAAAGCKVIVDDLTFYDQPHFEEGDIAKTVNNVAAQGITYVTSSGNYAQSNSSDRGHYENNFASGGPSGTLGNVHKFGTDIFGNNITAQRIDVRPNSLGKIFLQWSNRFGASSDDYDIYLVNEAGTIIEKSDGPQTGHEVPWEFISINNPTNSSATYYVVINLFSGIPQRLELYYSGITNISFGTPVSSIAGHANASGAITVGAINASDPGNDTIAPYSSQGPCDLFFPVFERRQKPDITGIDRVSVTGAAGFPTPFSGTSAAAPHIAAIAALMLQAKSTLTPAQIKSGLQSTSVDLGVPNIDYVFGSGRADAFEAVRAVAPSGPPNLTPSQLPGWSDKIVVSKVTGTGIDSALATTDTLYIDWAVLNNGDGSTAVPFFSKLYVDGVERNTWFTNPPLNVGDYGVVQDYSIGTLGAGLHTIKIVTDATGAITEKNEADNEYTKTINVVATQPNLTPFQPTGWSDRIVVSKVTGTNTNSSPLTTSDLLYVDWAVINNGDGPTAVPFSTKLYVDGIEKNTWVANPPFNVNVFGFVQDYPIGTLSAGQHTIKIITDTSGAVAEKSELDNEYSKVITVSASPTPTPPPPTPGTWSPTTLNSTQVNIQTWKQSNGHSYAKVKLTFPNAGYRVQDSNWGIPPSGVLPLVGNQLTADALVEIFNGASIQQLVTIVQIYDLGTLADGGYTFNFKTSGQTALAVNFIVTSAAPPANPIDNQREFVRWQYKDFLGREPDQAGWDFWTDNITKCLDAARRPPGVSIEACIDRQRETTSGAFFLSPEFQYTGYYVYRVFKGALGRAPYLSEFLVDQAFVGNGIITPAGLSGAQVNLNKQAFANQFVLRPEFVARYTGLTNAQYVDRLFQTTGVTPSAADRQALIDQLNANPSQRGEVLFKVVDGINVISEGNQQFTTAYGQAFYNQQVNPAFVQMEYFGYMRRDPDGPGFAFWLGKLNSFPSYIEAEMVRSFIVSPEYRSRFGAP